MELFLLIAIGLSLISFISVALTKTPPQTNYSPNSLFNEPEQVEGLGEARALSVESNILAEYPEPEVLPKLPVEGESAYPEQEILVSPLV